jgi:asparagine synthase (glutamine-hydrolysing)
MCGILATINHDSKFFLKSLDTMVHRGPDSSGVFHYKSLSLGHRRLSIQDLSHSANQPMYSTDDNLVIIFNGEIYNHWELRKSEVANYKFKTASDTETILALYKKYREKCVELLNGIFAFVILDKETDTVFIARDHFGVKPLYYSLDNEKFACASELKALVNFIPNKDIDVSAIQTYLTYMWCPGEDTPLKAVKKLLPGSFMKFSLKHNKLIESKYYYRLKYPAKIHSDVSSERWIEELETRLMKAVERQLLSDAPIGFFLSGGLDSSILVAMARKILPGQTINCYTIDSGESKDGFANDLDYARKVAKHLNVNLSEVKVSSKIVDDFDRVIWHLDEPQSDPAPFNVFKIAEQARKDGIKVLIGGTAGDDIFSGYRRHQALLIDKYFDSIPLQIRKLIKQLVSGIHSKSALIRRVKKLTKAIDKTKNERLVSYFQWQDFEFIQSLFKEDLQTRLKPNNDYFDWLLSEVEDLESDLNKLLFLEIYTFLVDHNLNYTDKAGMAHSVEIRVPFLDIELVEFSTTIPPSLKMKGKETKHILRKVAERYLPHDVIYRPKSGFGAPVEHWVRNDLTEFVDSNLSKKNLEETNLFNPERIRTIISDNESGKINASYNVWSLLAINSWIKSFVKNGE